MECDKSPKKKKMKIENQQNTLKRGNESDMNTSKRIKSENKETVDLQAMRRKNFVTACEQVSRLAYFDHDSRLQMMYSPACAKGCKHQAMKVNDLPKEATYAEKCLKIETANNMWHDALEVCQLCVTPNQYLSANMLKDMVEIMMNAHEDNDAEYTIKYLIKKSQEILAQNFSAHPPCLIKRLRKCYNDFLMSPMDLRGQSFTNRTEFGCDKGIVKYCINRLEYEISSESKDEALLDINENTPEDMKGSVKGLHWQKGKFEIYEVLERPERIQRLMAVLESIIELLQFDLAIWHSRYKVNLGNHIMRSHKPLVAYYLWSNEVLYTGTVNNNCKQILRLFVYMIHLQYPEEHIKTITTWLNVIIQTYYICETNSNSDYPNIGKYSTSFAQKFYEIISEMPEETIIKVLERIQPTFMRHLIGVLHVKTLVNTKEDDIIKILTNFIKNTHWQTYPESSCEITVSKIPVIRPRKIKILKYLSKKFRTAQSQGDIVMDNDNLYPKYVKPEKKNCNADLKDVVHVFYLTTEAYLDAYNVLYVQETLDKLNEQLLENGEVNTAFSPELDSYSVTEHFIKKYRSIFQSLKEMTVVLQTMKSSGTLPTVMKVFENLLE